MIPSNPTNLYPQFAASRYQALRFGENPDWEDDRRTRPLDTHTPRGARRTPPPTRQSHRGRWIAGGVAVLAVLGIGGCQVKSMLDGGNGGSDVADLTAPPTTTSDTTVQPPAADRDRDRDRDRTRTDEDRSRPDRTTDQEDTTTTLPESQGGESIPPAARPNPAPPPRAAYSPTLGDVQGFTPTIEDRAAGVVLDAMADRQPSSAKPVLVIMEVDPKTSKEAAIKYFSGQSGKFISAHALVDPDGNVTKLAPIDKLARAAGYSSFKGQSLPYTIQGDTKTPESKRLSVNDFAVVVAVMKKPDSQKKIHSDNQLRTVAYLAREHGIHPSRVTTLAEVTHDPTIKVKPGDIRIANGDATGQTIRNYMRAFANQGLAPIPGIRGKIAPQTPAPAPEAAPPTEAAPVVPPAPVCQTVVPPTAPAGTLCDPATGNLVDPTGSQIDPATGQPVLDATGQPVKLPIPAAVPASLPAAVAPVQ